LDLGQHLGRQRRQVKRWYNGSRIDSEQMSGNVQGLHSVNSMVSLAVVRVCMCMRENLKKMLLSK
jgi:cell division FtsZ-interacting protein ZapD